MTQTELARPEEAVVLYPQHPARLDYSRAAPGALRAQYGLEQYVLASGLEESLITLIKVRASIMNGCAYCLDMHTTHARQAGEAERRLYAVPVWRETPFFSPRERSALAWTEAVTRIGDGGVSDELYAEASQHFTEAELVNLTMAVVAINGWNRLAITFRTPVGQAPRA
ncbi:carboxymuconolactone decarboxylase family protein [Longimicrobium terrae]|uniref:AhpD family alkylhydroperoxidase n=1 Tax=Longimicrobium terrae TaxID=1639882 RepID=A0A841H5N7_9BACT|nr:carboxymuconolactone decarboxylase family protein [Longimicrobium terrae]MBB4639374.1 AhpD family alkylhydroperoxidase [Longimicrobium terrae]MBB6073555.1 AhpD family alkylhydroperoxidase [Longimicrobium terrae]NNC29436.1 carboxymuconolactone decarboxylase family protein [Longimicrobium terrae]